MSELNDGKNQQPVFAPTEFYTEPGGEDVFDIWRYWRIIRNRQWVILGVFVVVFITVGIRVYRTPPRYTASGTILIEPSQQQVAPGIQGFSPGDQSVFVGQIIQMQLDILESRRLAGRVIDKLKLWEYPEFAMSPAATQGAREKQRARLISRFLKGLNIHRPKDRVMGQQVIRVDYTSTNRRLAADVLNTLFETFIEYNREEAAEAVDSAAQWLTKQLAQLETKLRERKQDLIKHQQQMELLNLGDTEQNPALDQYSKLNEQLAEAEAALINAQIRYRLTHEAGVSALPGDLQDTALDGLKADRSRLQAQLSQLRTVYQDQAPPIQQLERQLADLDARIKQTEQSLVDKFENEYRVAQERVQALSQAAEKQRAEILKQNQDALQFSLLKGQVDLDEKLFQMLSERLREAKLMRSLSPNSSIRIIDHAEIPLAPSNSDHLTLVLGAMVGLVLGVGLAFLLEFLDDSVKTVDDVEVLLGLPNLGVIPMANGEVGRPLLSRKQPRGPRPVLLATGSDGNPAFAEAYRTLRTSVLLSSARRPPRAIVITGNEASAGKTTTAINTAIALAQAGKRVLLIDSDMRHPGCAQVFGIDNTAGLSTLLSFDDRPTAIHHDCVVAGLDVLPSGPIPPNPSELLSSEKIRQLIESVTTQYDHVIIDTPPLGLVSDALILSALADGVILVVKAEESSRRGILRAKDALRAVNARILGVVLNAVDMRRHQDGYYGYGYGYGYYYYQGEKGQEPKELRE